MININFICDRCKIKSENIAVGGFVIPFDAVPDDFFLHLDGRRINPIIMCKNCSIKNENSKPKDSAFVSQFHESPVSNDRIK